MLSNHLILCHLLHILPSIFPIIRIFSNELVFWIRWPKYWSFSFSISPSSDCSGLISFRIDWFSLLAVKVTLKSLLQHHNLKASLLPCLPIPKKGNAKECSNYCTIALISHANKIMLKKILQARLEQHVNQELPDVQDGFRKGRGTRDQIANISWIIEKAREFQKNICFMDYAKAFDCVDHNKLWKILKEMGIPDHLTYLLKNLYAGQEATVRTRHGIRECFKVAKGVWQGCTLSLCLFNLYAKYIMKNAGLEKSQAAIKIARKNIHNLRYADDITLMVKS